ncbi:MAG: ABC transporter ATP-binding protein [Deltaproteobacteria bacterium]|nr:ABC transporter ATP-binding protein [Deltaproteobacteria bacterium]MBW2069874.1 ABC transporter ATP-binding protein [Deltaproteobacteria bacterium]
MSCRLLTGRRVAVSKQSNDIILKIDNVQKRFGGVVALDGVSFEVEYGSITGLVGPNGSGKSTLFNVVSGFYEKDGGEIFFEGRKLESIEPDRIALMGIGRTFQISEVPEKMTVIENLLLAPKNQTGESVLNVFLRPGRIRQENDRFLQQAQQMLELVQLSDLRNEYAGNLSGGQKKLLALARILMADPTLILLDEPTAGVNPTLITKLITAILDLRDKKGKTLLIVEHNMKVISEICDKVVVLDFGRKIAEGTPEEIQKDEKVLEAYLSGSSREEMWKA